jgi:hypothetical protein
MCAGVVRRPRALGREAFVLVLALVVNVVPVDVAMSMIMLVPDHWPLIER